jgi:hypothetical protein
MLLDYYTDDYFTAGSGTRMQPKLHMSTVVVSTKREKKKKKRKKEELQEVVPECSPSSTCPPSSCTGYHPV